MKCLSRKIILEFEYETEKEREEHVVNMRKEDFICDGQIRRLREQNILDVSKEYIWFARFYKYE